MRFELMMASGLALALAACGKPAEVQPEAQRAGDPAVVVAAPASEVAMETGFPAVPSLEEIAAAAAAAGLPVTPEERLKLVCDNDEKLIVRLFPEQGIAVLVRADQNVELNREPSESGIRYSNGTTTITGDGTDYVVQIGMMAPMQCVAT